MTENEHSQIIALQYKGYGYKRIAAETGLALNTVKSFYARHPVQSKKPQEQSNSCRNCGKPLEQTPHKRKKMYCSDSCRMTWWNAHLERV